MELSHNQSERRNRLGNIQADADANSSYVRIHRKLRFRAVFVATKHNATIDYATDQP
jgi:hypothetical protein